MVRKFLENADADYMVACQPGLTRTAGLRFTDSLRATTCDACKASKEYADRVAREIKFKEKKPRSDKPRIQKGGT
jgi:hypothetical protein